jgi:enoyl-CoA hydratase/carnithine racemase
MVSSEATVLSDRHGQHIAINRPDARNAINGDVAQALEAAVNEAEADERLRVAVLTGADGRVFSAGADLKEESRGNLDLLICKDGDFAGFVHAKRRKPWIAAVKGLAVA